MLIPRDFYLIWTVLLLGFVFVAAFFVAFYINLVTETFPWRHLISTAVVTTVAFWLPNIIGNFVLPPVSFVNGVPQDFRSAVWNNIIYLCAFTAVLTFIVWQLIARRCNCRFPI
jgi:hypothetical protein